VKAVVLFYAHLRFMPAKDKLKPLLSQIHNFSIWAKLDSNNYRVVGV